MSILFLILYESIAICLNKDEKKKGRKQIVMTRRFCRQQQGENIDYYSVCVSLWGFDTNLPRDTAMLVDKSQPN